MFLPILVLAVAAQTPAARAPIKLAAPGFNFIDVDEKKGNFFVDYFGQEISQRGVQVVTKTEIATLVGFERQKQLLGCSEQEASCLAELAGALGVDGVIAGSIARIGKGYAVSLKVLNAKNASTMAAFSGRVPSDDALLDWLSATAAQLVAKVTSARPGEPPASAGPPSAASAPSRPAASPPAEVGVGRPASSATPSKPPAPPKPPGKQPLNTFRLSTPFIEVGYERRVADSLYVGVEAGMPMGLSDYAITGGLHLSAVARLEIGPPDGLKLSGRLMLGGGFQLLGGLAWGLGAEVRFGFFALGADFRSIDNGIVAGPRLSLVIPF